MRTIILITILLLAFNSIFSQHGKMGVYKNDGLIEIINSTEIDSIIFSDYFTCPGLPDVTYEGKIYHTVAIGGQCWLKENLNVGNMILGANDQTNNGQIEKYCWRDHLDSCEIYGGLYQWNEAMQYVTTEGAQGICPEGWHIPTLAEFQTLASTVNNDGNALKAIGQGWDGGAGTNTSGFSALLAGRRFWDGLFYDFYTGFIWTSTEDAGGYGYDFMTLLNNSSTITFTYFTDNVGYSIRCIKD